MTPTAGRWKATFCSAHLDLLQDSLLMRFLCIFDVCVFERETEEKSIQDNAHYQLLLAEPFVTPENITRFGESVAWLAVCHHSLIFSMWVHNIMITPHTTSQWVTCPSLWLHIYFLTNKNRQVHVWERHKLIAMFSILLRTYSYIVYSTNSGHCITYNTTYCKHVTSFTFTEMAKLVLSNVQISDL